MPCNFPYVGQMEKITLIRFHSAVILLYVFAVQSFLLWQQVYKQNTDFQHSLQIIHAD